MSTFEKFKKGVSSDEIVEEQKPQRQVQDNATSVILNQQDSYIHDRIKGPPTTFDDIKVEERKDGTHRLTLPEELKPYEKKFAFKWLYKSKRAIDEACDVTGWTLVSRILFPDLPNHLYSINGGIERGDTILAFMPKEKAMEIRRKPGEISKDILDSTFTKHKGDPRYYRPEDAETGSKVVMI